MLGCFSFSVFGTSATSNLLSDFQGDAADGVRGSMGSAGFALARTCTDFISRVVIPPHVDRYLELTFSKP